MTVVGATGARGLGSGVRSIASAVSSAVACAVACVVAFAASVAVAFSAAGCGGESAPDAEGDTAGGGGVHQTTQIGPGAYAFENASHRTFFVVTDDGVVAFDPISMEDAAVYASEIERIAPGVGLAAIVYSHHHADHASGAPALREAFGADVPIIAHENAAPLIVAQASPDQPAPDVTFGDQLTLHYGGRPLQLHYLGENHSDNSLVALLPEDGIAFAVDFVAHDRMGYQDLGSFSLPGQFESLRRLHDLPFQTIVLGHGENGDRDSVERQIAYYDDLREAAEAAHAAGQSEDEAAASITLDQYSDWLNYDTWFELNVRGMYRWVATQAP